MSYLQEFWGDGGFGSALAAGVGAAAVVVLGTLVLRQNGRRVPPVPVGLLLVTAVVGMIRVRFGVPPGLVAGLALLAGAGLLRWLVELRSPRQRLAFAAVWLSLACLGGWLLGWHAALPEVGWLRVVTAATAAAGGACLGSLDARWSRRGVGPAVGGLSVLGVYLFVPDTPQALVLLGIVLPMSAAALYFSAVRLGAAGSLALVGLLSWVVAIESTPPAPTTPAPTTPAPTEPIPAQSVPPASVPPDSVPPDSVPPDSVPKERDQSERPPNPPDGGDPPPEKPVLAVPKSWAYAMNTGGGCPASTSAADDVTDRMNLLLNDRAQVPNNATVQLTSNGCYRLDRTVRVNNSVGLFLDGSGATFQRFVHAPRAAGYTYGYPHFFFAGGSNLTIRNLSVKGLNTSSFVKESTTPQARAMHEPMKFGSGCTDNCFESGFIISPMDGLVMENLFIDATFGDGITLGGEHDFDLVRNAVLRNINIDRNGRQGVSPTTVNNVLLDNVNILHGYGVAYDTEVNGTGNTKNVEIRNSYANVRTVVLSVGYRGAQNIWFHDNVIQGANPAFPWAIFDNGPVSGIRLINNKVQRNRDEIAGVVLANASGYNEISGNVSAMVEPPAVRQSNRYGAVILGKTVTSGGLDGGVTGTVVINGNDFTRYTDLTVQTNVTATVSACGNRLAGESGFTQPSACRP